MTEQLTALDGTFLELEDADPAAHMHIGAILVFDPLPGGGAPSAEELAEQLDERVERLPRYKERLAHPDAGRMSWQHWEPDPDFHPMRHVRRAALPAPGGWDELLALAGTEFSRRLDRDRPLWEVVLVTGLSEGRWALISKTHHCLVDGVGSLDAASLLLDARPVRGGSPVVDAGDPPRGGRGLPLALRGPVGTVRAAAAAALRPRDTARRALALTGLVVRTELAAAPASSINAPIGPRRTLRGVRVDLDETRRISRALGGTVNDVALAAVTRGLRDLLLSRGEQPPESGLRAMVPMNVRGDGEQLGNRISSLFVDLPVARTTAEERYAEVRRATAALKSGDARLGADALIGTVERVPPLVHRALAPTLYGRRLFNLTVTNVPGPQVPLYAFGARLRRVWPLVPIASDHGVGVAIVSYDGQLVFGVNADADSVPDVDVLAEGIADGLKELALLSAAATTGGRPRRAPTRSP